MWAVLPANALDDTKPGCFCLHLVFVRCLQLEFREEFSWGFSKHDAHEKPLSQALNFLQIVELEFIEFIDATLQA